MEDSTLKHQQRLKIALKAAKSSCQRISYITRPFAGFTVYVENPAGTFRYGLDSDGHEWRTQMIYDYGFLPATKGADGEGVDVYLGPNEEAETAYVIHQQDPDTKEYDEDKVMLGFASSAEAEAAYRIHYDKDGFFQSMDEFPMDELAITVQKYQKKKKVANDESDHPFTVAVDLDGTLAQDYDEYDPDSIPPPRDGAVEWMKEFKNLGYRCIIFTVRGNEKLVESWMEEHGVPYDYINYNPDQPEDASDKVMADAYIDDKAVSAEDWREWDDIGDTVVDMSALHKAQRLRKGIAHWRANYEYIEYEIPNDRVKPETLVLALRKKKFDAYYSQEFPKKIKVKVPKGDDTDRARKEVQEILNTVMMGAKVPLRQYGKGISTDAVKTDTVSSHEFWLGKDQSSADPRHESEVPMGQYKGDERPGYPRPGSVGLPSRRARLRRRSVIARRVAAIEQPILVTAFGPFGEFESNSSWEAVKGLQGLNGIIVERLEVGFPILPQMEEIMDQYKPRVVFSFSQGHALQIETLAQNPGVEGPKEYRASADVRFYVGALSEMGYPIGVSSEAGGWYSEETLYVLEHLRATKYEDLDVLFVHLPPLDGVEVKDLKQFVKDLLMVERTHTTDKD